MKTHSLDYLRTKNSREVSPRPRNNYRGRRYYNRIRLPLTRAQYNLGERQISNKVKSAPVNLSGQRLSQLQVVLGRINSPYYGPNSPPQPIVNPDIMKKRKIYSELNIMTGFNGNPLRPYKRVSNLRPLTQLMFGIPSPNRRFKVRKMPKKPKSRKSSRTK